MAWQNFSNKRVAMMHAGKLLIQYPAENGNESSWYEYHIEVPSVSIGRAPSNRLMLDHPSIERRHIRLTLEGERVLVEDLGSPTGTLLAGQKIPAHQTVELPPLTWFQLGDVRLQYLPPDVTLSHPPATPPVSKSENAAAGVSPAEFSAEPQSSPVSHVSSIAQSAAPTRVQATANSDAAGIRILFSRVVQPLVPGETLHVPVLVRNLSGQPLQVQLRLAGKPAAWSQLQHSFLKLAANGQEQLTLSLNPPRTAQAAAGEQHLLITAINAMANLATTVELPLTVARFTEVDCQILPQGNGQFQFQVQNHSNTPVGYQLQARDPENALLLQLPQTNFQLAAGQSISLPFQAQANASIFIGAPRTIAFNVVGVPVTSETPEIAARGSLIVRPALPTALVPLLLMGCLVLCFGAYLMLPRLCAFVPNSGFCAPKIRSFTIDKTTVNAGEAVVLNWDVENAKVVSIQPTGSDPIGVVNLSGLLSVRITQNTQFTLIASDGKQMSIQTLAVRVRNTIPAITEFKVDPPTFIGGQPHNVTLSWKTAGAEYVEVPGLSDQRQPPNGSLVAEGLTESRTFTILAYNVDGSNTAQAAVNALPANCSIANLPDGGALPLRQGPADAYPVVGVLPNGSPVLPIGRIENASWLRLQLVDKIVWAPASFVKCGVDLQLFPTVSAQDVPLLVITLTPLATQTAIPSVTPFLTPTFTASPTALPPTALSTAIPPTAVPPTPIPPTVYISPTILLLPSVTPVPLATDTATALPLPSATLPPPPSITPNGLPSATPNANTSTTLMPLVDGILAAGEWDSAQVVTRLNNGVLAARNDSTSLYLLLDLPVDTSPDIESVVPPFGDSFWLYIDIDGNGQWDASRDVRYNRSGQLAFVMANSPLTFGPDFSSRSQVRSGFSATTNGGNPHRYWEIQVPLTELLATLGKTLRLGVEIVSDTPALSEKLPLNLDASQLPSLVLR